MTSGMCGFDEVIEGVKDETGIDNLRNHYTSIRRMIADAVFDINPYGALLIRKRVVNYTVNGMFDGISIKKPEDFVFLDEVGCCEEGICRGSWFNTISHIVLCDNVKRDKVTWSYWALQHDGQGNPVVTMNHKRAIIAYIIFKLYSPKIFMGTGSQSVRRDYKNEWEDLRDLSRGDDFFPDAFAMNRIYYTNQQSSLDMANQTITDFCQSCDCITENDEALLPSPMNVYFWQLANSAQVLSDVVDALSPTFFDNKPFENYSVFSQGFLVPYIIAGTRAAFAIKETELEFFQITDQLGNDVTHIFQSYYSETYKAIIYVSINPYTHSTIYFKFKKLNNV